MNEHMLYALRKQSGYINYFTYDFLKVVNLRIVSVVCVIVVIGVASVCLVEVFFVVVVVFDASSLHNI